MDTPTSYLYNNGVTTFNVGTTGKYSVSVCGKTQDGYIMDVNDDGYHIFSPISFIERMSIGLFRVLIKDTKVFKSCRLYFFNNFVPKFLLVMCLFHLQLTPNV